MRKITSAVALTAGLFTAGLVSAGAQTPTPSPQTPSPTAQQPTRTPAPSMTQPATAATMTIVGCLKEEKDVAGLKPNVAERAGITEDYILTSVKAAPGSSVSGLALGAMYEIEGIAEAELKKHLNHQVEIQGRIEASDLAPSGDRDRKDVPDFNATSLKMLATTCPAQ